MLQILNAPTLAIRGLDTAENGPSKVRQLSNEVRHSLGLQHEATDTLEGAILAEKEHYSRTWQVVFGGIVMFGFVFLMVTWFPDERRHDLHLTHMRNHLALSSPLYAVSPLVERYAAVKFGTFQRNLSNFRGLVLFSIGADFCNQILVF